MTTGLAIPTDPAVPGLGVALRADDLFEILSARLPECREGIRFTGGRAVDVQFTPGVGAQVLWKIKAHDPETGRTGRQFIFVRALHRNEPMPAEPTELVRRYKQIRSSKSMARQMPFRTPWLAVSNAGIIVNAFPLDPALPTLVDIADPAAMKQALELLWQARRAHVRRVRVATLSYTPGMRAAMRYEVLAEDTKSLIPELRHLVGKLDVLRSPARLFAGHWTVWRRTFGRVSVPPPVGYLAVARLSLQEFLTGTRLSDVAGKSEFAGKVRKTARAISAVHSLTLPVLKHRGVEKEMAGIDRWAKVLAQLRSAQANRIAELSRRMRSELTQRMKIAATVHADFHLANVLSDEHGVTLVDWDQAAHGDPMLDIGRFLSSLRVSAFRLNGTLDGLADIEETFLSAYLDRTGDDERRARLFEAASLFTAATAPFRLQREGWQGYADLMIDEVERVLDLACSGPRVPGTPADFQRQVPFEERHVWAADGVYSQALLVPVIHQAYGSDIEVIECRPRVMERSASRLRVRWKLRGYKAQTPWTCTLNAIGYTESASHGPQRRIMQAREVTVNDPTTLQLPRPLGLVKPLSMNVFEHANGESLLRLLGTRRESDVMQAVAYSLSRLHASKIRVTKERVTERVIASAQRSVEVLERSGHADAITAREFLSALKSILETAGERRAPTIYPLSLRQLRVTETGVAASYIRDFIMAEPLVTAASVAAQLRLIALKRSRGRTAVDRFNRVYLDASGESEHLLNAWQAVLMLRVGCNRAARDPSSSFATIIIDCARELVEEVLERRAS